MSVWDTSTPAGSDLYTGGDDRIREMKTALQDALRGGGAIEGAEAIFPGPTPSSSPVFKYRGIKGSTAERPAAGYNGLFFDTTRNALQRDNGVSWDDVSTVIPSGTVMVFYQASAPVGWTKDATQNDKALRVVSGSGGGVGGTHDFSTPPSVSHTHTITAEAITVDQMPSHRHLVASGNSAGGIRALSGADSLGFTAGDDVSVYAENLGLAEGGVNTCLQSTGGGATHNHGGTSGTGTLTAFAPKYIDVIVCSKD